MGGVVMSRCMSCLVRSFVMGVCNFMALFVMVLSGLALIQRLKVQISMLVVTVEWFMVELVVL